MNLDAARDDRAFVRVVGGCERAVVQTQSARDVVESFGQVVLQSGVACCDVAAVAVRDGVAERLSGRGCDVVFAFDEFEGRQTRVGGRREARAVAEDVDDCARVLRARVECVGDGRERVDADGELLAGLARVRVYGGDDADALAAREARTHRRAERYLAVGGGHRAGSVGVEVERDERGGRGNVYGGDGVEVGSVAGVADAEEARDALAGRDRGRRVGLVGSDRDGGDGEDGDGDDGRDDGEARAFGVRVGRLGAVGNSSARPRSPV